MDKEFYNKIHGWFDFEKIYKDQVANAKGGETFVEIGTHFGKSAIYMADLIKESKKKIEFITVDFFRIQKNDLEFTDLFDEYRYNSFLDNAEKCGVLDFIAPVVEYSVKAAKFFDDKSLDFVFIDGDHAYKFIMSDIIAWYPKVKVGGILAGHDVGFRTGNEQPVKKAISECFNKNYTMSNGSWIHRVENNSLLVNKQA